MKLLSFFAACAFATSFAWGAEPPPLLNLPGMEGDPAKIDYAALPLLKGTHAVISPFNAEWKFQLHDYLMHHGGRFWSMWSHGPEVEDMPTQDALYATSADGLHWSEPKPITGPPAEGRAYIARGFWVRDGELLALAAYFKGKGAFGVNKELTLQAFAWDEKGGAWKPRGLVYDNAINNFAPEKISTGEWLMTRRDSRFNVSMLRGGQRAIDDWRAFPVVERMAVKGFSPDEPIWWEQPDHTLVGLFRDNGGSSRLYRASSTDQGQTWTIPVKTEYPNASSKIFSLRTSAGDRVLIGNANPKLGRRELHLALSRDGLTFTHLARLEIPMPKPSTLQYPNAIEHDGFLYITFSRNKNVSEVFRVALEDISALRGEK